MNRKQLQDALGDLPEELIASTAQVRQKKKLIYGPWIAAAACACLVIALGAKVLPVAMNHGAVSDAVEFAPGYSALQDMEQSKENHVDDSAHAEAVLIVRVKQVADGHILVSLLDTEEQDLYAVPVEKTDGFTEGEVLRIYYDGMILETWPMQLGKIYGIERVKEGNY